MNPKKYIEKNIDTFVGAMMQLGEGAIGDSREQAFERIIAQNIAYLLFDDFDTIGDSSSNAIHIMNLKTKCLQVQNYCCLTVGLNVRENPR